MNAEKSLCRIKRYQSSYSARKIRLKKDKTLEEFKQAHIIKTSDKRFDEFIEKNESKSNRRLFSKYHRYDGDLSYMDDDILPYYLIDNKLEIYDLIDNIRIEDGFKFRRVSSLKKHCFCELQDNGYDDRTLRMCIDYFFEKNIASFKAKRQRLYNKAYANLDIWNYFATFTYDDNLLSEHEFYEKLKKYLSNNCFRNNWKYMGVFEKSKAGRLHFHALISIPNDDVVKLNLKEEQYYNKSLGIMSLAHISQALKQKFGRCDFAPVYKDDDSFVNCLSYMLKYILKDGNKIVYSRGLKDECIGLVPNFDDHVLGFLYTSNTEFLSLDADVNDQIEIFEG